VVFSQPTLEATVKLATQPQPQVDHADKPYQSTPKFKEDFKTMATQNSFRDMPKLPTTKQLHQIQIICSCSKCLTEGCNDRQEDGICIIFWKDGKQQKDASWLHS